MSEYKGKERGIGLDQWVSDKGDPLLINESDGTVFVNGAWQPVRSDAHELVVPLTPNFRAQCGVIFCDRVVSRLGVVARKRVASRATRVRHQDVSPDGRFAAILMGLDEARLEGIDIVDVRDGHVVMHIDQYQPRFTPDEPLRRGAALRLRRLRQIRARNGQTRVDDDPNLAPGRLLHDYGRWPCPPLAQPARRSVAGARV